MLFPNLGADQKLHPTPPERCFKLVPALFLGNNGEHLQFKGGKHYLNMPQIDSERQ